MIQPLFSWKTALSLIAIAIVSGTIFYSQFLARKIAREERLKVEQWVEAGKLLLRDSTGLSNRLVSLIITENKSIPIIVTDENDDILDHVNLDPPDQDASAAFLAEKLKEFRSQNAPIEWINPSNPSEKNLYYYGHTPLLNQVRYYPLVQLLIVGLFIAITFIALTTSFRSSQNQIWAGMAKETAHQLGTPISSLQGWVEMLKANSGSQSIAAEMEKDVARLMLVSDRFGKIGSKPQLESSLLTTQVSDMVEYIRRRAPGSVNFRLEFPQSKAIMALISPPLFDWVIENLLKNALDALEGRGEITVSIKDANPDIFIDITDTGKGIAKQHLARVFSPGFTTKKRGWGLGLSLAKRIIEQYHRGRLFVKQSEPGRGTTFRIVLKRSHSETQPL